jgi:hypothetical protein
MKINGRITTMARLQLTLLIKTSTKKADVIILLRPYLIINMET